MKNKKNWLILLIIPAVAGYLAIQNNLSRENETTSPLALEVTDTVPSEPLTELSTFTPTYEGCAFMWAYQDLPELGAKLDASVRALNEDASASAYAFGEDCVYADGHKTFSAKETDFNIDLKVADLMDEEFLGNWIYKVMPIVLQIPPEELSGPQPGFVEFRFVKSDTEQIVLRVPLRDYPLVASDKSGGQLFRWYHIPPTSPT